MITVLSILMWGLLALGGVVVLVAVIMAAFDALPDPPQEPRSLLGSLPESEIERVIEAAKAAKPGGAS